jgi:hypothetical protein
MKLLNLTRKLKARAAASRRSSRRCRVHPILALGAAVLTMTFIGIGAPAPVQAIPCPSSVALPTGTTCDLTADTDDFKLTMGGQFGANAFVNNFTTASVLWAFEMDLSLEPNRVVVAGTGVHVGPPPGHPETGAGGVFGFTVIIDPSKPIGDPLRAAIVGTPASRRHGGHRDDYRDGQPDPSGPLGAFIAGPLWGFTLTGEHVPSPVPEPTTLLLMGTTAAGIGLARWRQRRRRQQTAPGD